ncbi:MAG: histidinol dehydrogenase [Firmicutes bacterium]|nr:histidinol dehydrogenase [Bacillota bacterium]
MRIVSTDRVPLEELVRLAARPPLEEMEIHPAAAERIARLFGEPLSPAEAVARIAADVQRDGDRALARYAERLDGMTLPPERFFVSEEEIEAAYRACRPEVVAAIGRARDNIRMAHEAQRRRDWFCSMPSGAVVGQRYIPLERVAAYVPGGRFPLVSTALMTVVPARVAGVDEVIVATPAGKDGRVNPYVLVAAREAGAHRILRIGGAHGVAALAYGTETVPAVDKIVGPGNVFVQLAKKHVFGRVGIDSLAGPSEILVLADESAPPGYAAADLLSQAEHDTEAAAWLVTDSPQLARAVAAEVRRQLEQLPDPAVARASLERWGLIAVCRDMAEAVELANRLAPEHLELLVREPLALLGRIRHAGAVFVGPYTPEVIGDYIAGPNHVLPTNGTARFASQLSVDDFVRRSGLVAYTPRAVQAEGRDVELLAEIEGLVAHGRAVRIRMEGDGLR